MREININAAMARKAEFEPISDPFEFEKGPTECVIGRLYERKGKQYVDVRLYFEADDEHHATKKGLFLPLVLLPKLKETVDGLASVAVEKGLLEEEEMGGEANLSAGGAI